ncbi:endonuclease I family protein [Haploplasma axanthum]|uniref:Extracellular ribonuclease n=1 Tax=Haploplasma axanthum TaxID=29552 RepID=A0A449BCG9_HAPAX|nr:endonuclease [Haploplasma axanthum]VEU80128.1 Extracellular ribonuclease precursor [Haploplasma axanthum]
MKKIFYLLLLITTSIILVSCAKEPSKTYTIKVYDNDSLINNYFIEHGESLDKEEFDTLITSENFKYWSTSKDGVKYTFELPITSDLELYSVYESVLPPTPINKIRITLIIDSKQSTFELDKDSLLTEEILTSKYTGSKTIKHWSATNNGTKYMFPISVTTDLTFYAVFETNSIPDPTPEPTEPIDLGTYYKSVKGLNGDSLKNGLNKVIGTAKATSYDQVKAVLVRADLVYGSTNRLHLIYDSKETHNKWDNAATWNREHVWPQSKLNGAPKGESHNLRASDVKTNSNRGNDPFAEGSGDYGKRVSGGYFPGDEHKGDVARIVMYMIVRYPQLNFGNSIGSKEMFLRWHKEDAVSNFEKQRNDVIHDMQGNRNPFIDHPEFADMIWGSKVTKTSIINNTNKVLINLISTEILFFEEKRNYIQ